MSRSFAPFGFSRGPNLNPFTERPYHSTSRNEANDEERSEGYDEFFDPPLESKYECPICHLGLREPVQTSCGHRFCKGCIKRSIRDEGPKCPTDNEPLSANKLYPDNFAKREMMLFTVACRHKKLKGCDWKGPLRDLQEHLKNCPFVDIECPNGCGETLQRMDWDQHIQQCPWTVSCEHCKKDMVQTVYRDHLKDCPKATMECGLCITSSIARDEMDEHLKRYCPMVNTTCPLSGCSFEGLRYEVKEHYKISHLEDHMFDLAMTVRELTQKSQAFQQETDELKRRQTCHEHETDLKLTGIMDTVQKSQNQTQVETRIRYDQAILDMTHRQVRLETRLEECVGRMCNGTYIWRVENFRQLQQDAINGTQTAIDSPPFFASMYGHKMCMRINLNGVDSGVGKHISLFVHMMQGEWDEVVEWPFTGRITLSILDQRENVEHRRHIMETLIAKPNLLAFQRPTAPRNYEGYGYVEFAPIDTLLNGEYVKKNVLLVRIQVIQ